MYSWKLLCILRAELNLFFIVLSVLPGMYFAMCDHFFPCLRKRFISLLSSSKVHLFLTILGSKWLCHLSRHYFPIRPGKNDAMKFQPLAPCSMTWYFRSSSSFSVQVPLFPFWTIYYCYKLSLFKSGFSWSISSTSSSIPSASWLLSFMLTIFFKVEVSYEFSLGLLKLFELLTSHILGLDSPSWDWMVNFCCCFQCSSICGYKDWSKPIYSQTYDQLFSPKFEIILFNFSF